MVQKTLKLSTPKGHATRENILDAALKIASQAGLEGLTIGSLARDVGMSKSGLFAHFNSKDNLQLMVLQRAADVFTNQVIRAAITEPRGEPRVCAIFENWVEFLNEGDLPGGSIFVAAAFELDDRPGVLRNYVQKAQRDLITNLKKAASIAIEEGHFSRESDAGQFAWSMYAYVLGYHHSKRMLEDPKAEKHLRRAFESLLTEFRNNGIKKDQKVRRRA